MLGIQVAVSPEVTKALVFLFSLSSLPTHMYEPKQLKKNTKYCTYNQNVSTLFSSAAVN